MQSHRRQRREVDQNKNTCRLFLQSDWVLYETYNSVELIVSKMAEHVKAANRIYGSTPFKSAGGVPFLGLNFRVLRIRVSLC